MQHFSRHDAKTRFQNAQNVESTIVEVPRSHSYPLSAELLSDRLHSLQITGMYTRMATMVAEQGEIISRIDDDMDVAYVVWNAWMVSRAQTLTLACHTGKPTSKPPTANCSSCTAWSRATAR